MVSEIASEQGGGNFRWTTKQDERNKLWQARHDAYYASLALKPGSRGMTTDVCVPISRLAECILETKKDMKESKILAPLIGHVGDGNFHLIMLIGSEEEDELKQVEDAHHRLVMRALGMGGTCTGEHGIGMGKKVLLRVFNQLNRCDVNVLYCIVGILGTGIR